MSITTTTHAQCVDCNGKFGGFLGKTHVKDGRCVECDAKVARRAARAKEEADRREEERIREVAPTVIISTETVMTDLDVQKRLGIVSCTITNGLGPTGDFGVGVAGMLGGSANKLERSYAGCYADAIATLQVRAAELGTNAVVGVSFVPMTNGQANFALVSAYGTAVLVR